MANIQHPSMKRRDSAGEIPQEETRVATVMPPEDEAFAYDEDEEFEEMVRQQGVSADQVMEDPVIEQELEKQKTLERLMMFKKPVFKEFTIDGLRFKLKMLTPSETHKVFTHIVALEEQTQVAKTPNMILAAALMDVNGVRVEETYDGDPAIVDPILRRFSILQSWPQPLIKTLNRAYNEFSTAKEKEFSYDFLDESPKTNTTG